MMWVLEFYSGILAIIVLFKDTLQKDTLLYLKVIDRILIRYC